MWEVDSLAVGPFTRGEKATLDEAEVVARLLIKADDSAHTMIDVGAHYGSSLRPFAEAGWRVIAFEPDQANRKVLVDGMGLMPNVLIDSRALSASSAEAVPFFVQLKVAALAA